MLALKKKKAYEQQLNQLSGTRLTIETQIMAIENATITYASLNAISSGTTVLSQLNRNMDIDQVQDTLDDIQDQMQITQEIGEALSNPIGLDLNDDELQAELDALVEDDFEDNFKDIKVPQTKLEVKPQEVAVDEDDELDKLGEELGL